jgi:hypothetical protein
MSAIIGAIYDATGVLINELPATPEKILAGLARLNEADTSHSRIQETRQ